MRAGAVILATIFGTGFAAPAIVWNNGSEKPAVYSSNSVKVSSLLAELVKDGKSDDSSLAAAVFLLGRSDSGAESLSEMTIAGSLPAIASKYHDASFVYSHVTGIESTYAVARDVSATTGRRVQEASLEEFTNKLTSLERDSLATQLEVDQNGITTPGWADIVVVSIPASTPPSAIDDAVTQAIGHGSIGNVLLAGIRSVDEIKGERVMEMRRKMKVVKMENLGSRRSSARRRLEDANGNDDGNNNNNNDDDEDLSDIYYVQITPNILGGLMFALMFALVTCLGICCMGSVAAQDVYVSKMPSTGREA